MIRYGVVQEKVADKQNDQQQDTKEAPPREEGSVSDTDSKTTSSQVKETDK